MINSSCLRFQVMKTTGSDVEEDAQEMALCTQKLPERKTLKERVASLVYGNRMLSILVTARKWREFHAAWRRIPFCHVVRYEDLLQKPNETMQGVCRYLEIPINEDQINETLHKLSFKEITGRRAGEEQSNSIMFRKAVVGDHKKKLGRFSLALIRRFCGEEASHFGYRL
jgi:hypothetical protein